MNKSAVRLPAMLLGGVLMVGMFAGCTDAAVQEEAPSTTTVVSTTMTTDSTTKQSKTTTTTAAPTTTSTTKKPTVESGAATSESALSNAYKLLTQGDRRLTIGYLGGSITLGTSAEKDGGSFGLSWVNRVSAWFAEQFPNAVIETVNAGVSDTATNFGLFRLEQCLMNENGHDMPDVVFVEFTTNDWEYDTQSSTDLEYQIESLFRNIWSYNPCVEIVVISTNRAASDASFAAYTAIAERYRVPVIDVGAALVDAMKTRGYAEENAGTGFYYTTDNLHPSHRGYEVYYNEIKRVLESELTNLSLQSKLLYDYAQHLPAAKHPDALITNPTIIPATSLTFTGGHKKEKQPLTVSMYGTDQTVSTVELVPNRVALYNKTTVTLEFNGNTLGLLLQMEKDANVEMTYAIDGGAEQTFLVDDSHFGWQRYAHAQVFMLGHNLGGGKHTVTMTFVKNRVNLAGVLVNGAP